MSKLLIVLLFPLSLWGQKKVQAKIQPRLYILTKKSVCDEVISVPDRDTVVATKNILLKSNKKYVKRTR